MQLAARGEALIRLLQRRHPCNPALLWEGAEAAGSSKQQKLHCKLLSWLRSWEQVPALRSSKHISELHKALSGTKDTSFPAPAPPPLSHMGSLLGVIAGREHWVKRQLVSPGQQHGKFKGFLICLPPQLLSLPPAALSGHPVCLFVTWAPR